MQADPALIPELGGAGIILDQEVVELEGCVQISSEQVDFGHGLEIQPPILPGIEPELILSERLFVVALLPKSKTEVVVSQQRARNRLRRGGNARRRRASIQSELGRIDPDLAVRSGLAASPLPRFP